MLHNIQLMHIYIFNHQIATARKIKINTHGSDRKKTRKKQSLGTLEQAMYGLKP